MTPLLLTLVMVLVVDMRSTAEAGSRDRGTVEVALVDSPSPQFQQLALNIVSVRLNPSTDLNVSDFDSRWQTIAVPAGVGAKSGGGVGVISAGLNLGGNFGFNGQSTGIGQGRSEIQVDFNQLQQMAQIFNGGRIVAQSYGQVELIVDPFKPGNLTPICGQSSRGEGCINYPIALSFPASNITQTIRANFFAPGSPGGQPVMFDVGKDTVTTLVIDVNLGIPAPGTPGTSKNPTDPSNTPFTVTPTISVVPNATTGATNPDMAIVSGTVSNLANKNEEVVNTEVSGTGQIVASMKPLDNGTFTLGLPAAPGGTTYDIYTSGPDRAVTVLSGQVQTSPNLTLRPGTLTILSKLSPATQTTTSLGGTIDDNCTGSDIQGATLQLLAPDGSTPATDCSQVPTPTGCVVVASASTDAVGRYPMPGSAGAPAPFNQIASGATYGLVVTASGYDPLTARVTSSSNGGFQCTVTSPTGAHAPNGACSLRLARAQLIGAVTTSSPNPNSALNVLVMAEDHGTNRIESVGIATIPANGTSGSFTMSIPTSTYLLAADPGSSGQVDLFASAQELFAGAPEQYSGHTIAVLSGVPSATAASACNQPVTVSANLGPINCSGYGSVSGNVTTPFDSGTTAVLSKNNVQLMSTAVGPSNTANAGRFSICAPSDGYTLTRNENGAPVSSQSVTLTPPEVVTTAGCSSVCQPPSPTAAGSCFLCQASTPVTLVP